MSLAAAIKSRLADYLRGATTLQEWAERFVPATCNAEDAGDPAAVDLTDEIVRRRAECASGDHTEDQLKALLRPLAVEQPPRPVAAG